ncbi:unnamed protein product [Prunus armeniaca]|uniref:Uncharacterized protein n=1 Tax=Prunus armeniaca TaxID=36596 RepID=A0A6J5VUU0_PRUAR|nr:unnamed protein product [Prunus armeniaca]CAB4322106.1 unnamed protein product [Prunus armeniaca]
MKRGKCRKRRLRMAVKTIDNDVLIMDKTSGVDTAVEEAQWAINSAYNRVSDNRLAAGLIQLCGGASA